MRSPVPSLSSLDPHSSSAPTTRQLHSAPCSFFSPAFSPSHTCIHSNATSSHQMHLPMKVSPAPPFPVSRSPPLVPQHSAGCSTYHTAACVHLYSPVSIHDCRLQSPKSQEPGAHLTSITATFPKVVPARCSGLCKLLSAAVDPRSCLFH